MDKILTNKSQLDKINNYNKIILEKETLLLVIDMQEKLISKIKGNRLLAFNIKKLIDACNLLNVRIAITEQNPLKLGETLKSILENKDYPKFKKMEFSCCKNDNLIDYMKKYNFKNVIVCGIESHICVLQTSIELLEKGFNILIPKDAIGSRNDIDNDTAFIRLTLLGAVASTTESLICELCKTAERKEFKEISKILKNSFSN